jgi:hypothetical protein
MSTKATFLALTILLAAGRAYGQPPAPGNVLVVRTAEWDAPTPTCTCTYELSVDGTVIGVTPLTSLSYPAPAPGLHVITVVAIDDQQRRSAPATIADVETSGPLPLTHPCTYIAPGSTVSETRPIGATLQGFNPIGPSGSTGNQAERLQQLIRWGWTLTLGQFVDGSVRPDKIDRLFLAVTCAGLP